MFDEPRLGKFDEPSLNETSVCPSGTVPLLSLEAAAQEESFLERRDAQIAACFGFQARRVTALRRSEDRTAYLRWEMLEERLLQDGDNILAARLKRQSLRDAARQERLRRAEREEAEYRRSHERQHRRRRLAQVAPNPFDYFPRVSFALLDFFSQDWVLLPLMVGAALYFALEFLCPDLWAGAWGEVKSFLTGVVP